MAAEPYAWQILAGIVARLQAATGTGDYHNDLSGSGRVQYGDPKSGNPGPVPCVWLTDYEVQPAEWADLGTRGLTAVATLTAFAGAEDATALSRIQAALRLASDCALALQGGTPPGQLGLSLAQPVLVTASAIDGHAIGYAGYGIALLRVEARYYRGAGTGL